MSQMQKCSSETVLWIAHIGLLQNSKPFPLVCFKLVVSLCCNFFKVDFLFMGSSLELADHK